MKLCRKIFVIAAVIAIPLRIYLHLFHINPQTGFYEGGKLLMLIQNIVLLAAVAAIIFLGWRTKIEKPVIVPSSFLRIAAIAGGLGAAFLSIPNPVRLAGPAYMPNSTLMMAVQIVSLTVFPLVAAATLFYIGIKSKTQFIKVNGLASIVIDLWMVIFLMTRFMEYTASRHVSDQMLTVVALALGSLLFIPLGRLCAGISIERASQQVIALGLPFSLIVFTLTPGIILTAGKGATLALTGSESIAMLFLGIYAVSVCFSLRETP